MADPRRRGHWYQLVGPKKSLLGQSSWLGLSNEKWALIFALQFVSFCDFHASLRSVMKEYPESEIQAKFFADAGEKRSEHLAKNFADFCPLISRKSGGKKFHKKSSTFSTRDETKLLSPRDSGRGVPQRSVEDVRGFGKRGHASKKRVLDPHSVWYDPPPSGIVTLFSCTEIPRLSTPEAFGRVRCLVGFPPPLRFAPPHIKAQEMQ